MMALPGNGAWLRCVECGGEEALGPRFEGCARCAARGRVASLEVRYDYAQVRRAGALEAWPRRPGGLWRFRELLPVGEESLPVTLEEGGTPLLRLPTPGPGRIWIKDETRNPTGAFKDRFHAVSLSVARALGFRKVAASTTGNHGTSLAAYAARAELDCVVFCDPRAPAVQRRLMQFFGAHVAVLATRRQHLAWLVRERKWYPSTNMTPRPVGTPFGAEGYKTIAFEIFGQLGRMPEAVFVPVAAGDGLYGSWKGFRELRELGVEDRPPRMVAVQAAGCDPVVQGFVQGLTTVPVHPSPQTCALSIADETAGAVALRALRESAGAAVAVSDEALGMAARVLARLGLAVEPAAAASVAGALAEQQAGRLGAQEDVVCLVTGALVKWPDVLEGAVDGQELADPTDQAVQEWVREFDVD
jgi:threonine synthase